MKAKQFFSLLLVVLFIPLSISTAIAQKVTLSGYIKDGETGEALIGATLSIPSLGQGTSTNVYGFYSLSVEAGEYTVTPSFIGYETQEIKLNLTESQTLNIELLEESNELDEIVVVAEKENENIANTEISTQKMTMATIKKMPALLGEVDVIKSIQLLPGVSTVGEGASGFNVRGGSIDQNLVLLDEAPVFNSSHLFGFFSVFNPDAVKDVKLYKGGIPARYGGRLSSILDVRMKEGNSKKFALNGGVGIIFSRLAIEAPIVKDKASFIIAGRRSYADVLARPFLKDDIKDSKLYFYDLTLKTNYAINNNNQLFLSGYFGRDVFRFSADAGFDWGNSTLSLRWNHLFSDKLFSNITTFRSQYDYSLKFGDDEEDSFDWNASIVNYAVKPKLTYYLNSNNKLSFGGEAVYNIFEPGNASGRSEGEENNFSLDRKFALESALYLENDQTLSDKISLLYGLRFSHFNYMGEGTKFLLSEATNDAERRDIVGVENVDKFESIKTYANLEPRLSMKYQIDESSSIKLGYNRTVQYLHLISNSTASTPIDVWTPSTNNIPPQKADQLSIGYFKNLKDNMFETSFEVYYKDYQNLMEYIEGADLFLNPGIEGELLPSDGRAYGLEVYVEKKKGKVKGWLSYTFSRTEKKVEGISNSEWFPSRFDQPHNLSLTGFYEFSKRFSVSANFVFSSGTPATFPTSRFEQQGYVVPFNYGNARNNVRIPNYHRLDLSATLKSKDKGKRFNSEWVFGVYNVYQRRNPFSIFFKEGEGRHTGSTPIATEAVRLSIIGRMIPSVSWNFSF